jgi:hypothetical protein
MKLVYILALCLCVWGIICTDLNFYYISGFCICMLALFEE